MTLTLDVPKELEARLETEATRNGISTDEFVRKMLEDKLGFETEKRKPPFEARIIATGLPSRDFSITSEWLEKHRDEYDGKYVALDGDTLIAVSENGKDLAVRLRKLGVSGAFITFVEGTHRPPFISGGLWRE